MKELLISVVVGGVGIGVLRAIGHHYAAEWLAARKRRKENGGNG